MGGITTSIEAVNLPTHLFENFNQFASFNNFSLKSTQ